MQERQPPSSAKPQAPRVSRGCMSGQRQAPMFEAPEIPDQLADQPPSDRMTQAIARVPSVRGNPARRYSANPTSTPSRLADSKTMTFATEPMMVRLPASVEN